MTVANTPRGYVKRHKLVRSHLKLRSIALLLTKGIPHAVLFPLCSDEVPPSSCLVLKFHCVLDRNQRWTIQNHKGFWEGKGCRIRWNLFALKPADNSSLSACCPSLWNQNCFFRLSPENFLWIFCILQIVLHGSQHYRINPAKCLPQCRSKQEARLSSTLLLLEGHIFYFLVKKKESTRL